MVNMFVMLSKTLTKSNAFDFVKVLEIQRAFQNSHEVERVRLCQGFGNTEIVNVLVMLLKTVTKSNTFDFVKGLEIRIIAYHCLVHCLHALTLVLHTCNMASTSTQRNRVLSSYSFLMCDVQRGQPTIGWRRQRTE